MNRVCFSWVPRILTSENLAKRVELSKQFIKRLTEAASDIWTELLQLTRAGSTTTILKQHNSLVNGKM